MAFKFVIISCLVALVRAGNIPVVVEPAPAVVAGPALARLEEFSDSNPDYSFGYNVVDQTTGDIKSQNEVRSGNLVQGQYTLRDADGWTRVVNYADYGDGFRADVTKVAPQAVGVVEPAVVEPVAPVVTAARYATAVPAPVPAPVSAPAPVLAPAVRYTALPSAFNPLARYAAFPGYQPFARLAAAPFSYPGPAAQVVAV